jgi:hypothetical protein
VRWALGLLGLLSLLISAGCEASHDATFAGAVTDQQEQKEYDE